MFPPFPLAKNTSPYSSGAYALYFSRNPVIVIILGLSISSTKKSLSPVTKTSIFSIIAVARMGESF
jgi:hypothetical protein